MIEYFLLPVINWQIDIILILMNIMSIMNIKVIFVEERYFMFKFYKLIVNWITIFIFLI